MTPKPQNNNPNHRTMSFRKARLMREAEAEAKAREEMMAHVKVFSDAMFAMTAPRIEGLYNCGCIDHNDDAFVGCESCGYKSCLDCHHIDSTPANVDDWKCKEGYGCNHDRLEQHANMELEQAAQLAADIRGEEE